MIIEEKEALRKLLVNARRIAVVGCSPKPERDSHVIARYLIDAGYDVIPVNPGQTEILGKKCYPDVASIPEPVDIADVFRSPEHMPGVVEDVIQAKAKCVWMQLETSHPDAVKRADAAGLDVVVDKCIKVVHGVLRIVKN